MDKEKLAFISNKLIMHLNDLPAASVGKWGKMNAQQMVEHLGGFFKVSTGKLKFPIVTPMEHLPKYKEFLYSDKDFRENTKASVLPEEPLPIMFTSIKESLADLEEEVKTFNELFSKNEVLITQHPVFGNLNYEEWVLLHYKHVTHHLRQFGLLEN